MTRIIIILKSLNSKEILIFVLSGLLFIFVAKASMNINAFFERFFSVFVTEFIFLLFSYLIYILVSKRVNNPVFSFASYFIFLGVLNVLFIEYFYNNNRDFSFFVFLFLFVLKGLQLSVARVSVDRLVPPGLRKIFLKRLLGLYLLYIFVGLLSYFAFSSINIWSFGFLVLIILMFFVYLLFLLRFKIPKKTKDTKIAYKDVSFY